MSFWAKGTTPTWIVGVIYMGVEMVFFGARPHVIGACVTLILGLSAANALKGRNGGASNNGS